MANAPWFITNKNIHKDLEIPLIKEEIKECSARYLGRLENHVNPLAVNLLNRSNETQRLKRYRVLELPYRS